MEIRGFTIKFSKIKAKRRRNEESNYKIKPISYWNKLKRAPATKSF